MELLIARNPDPESRLIDLVLRGAEAEPAPSHWPGPR